MFCINAIISGRCHQSKRRGAVVLNFLKYRSSEQVMPLPVDGIRRCFDKGSEAVKIVPWFFHFHTCIYLGGGTWEVGAWAEKEQPNTESFTFQQGLISEPAAGAGVFFSTLRVYEVGGSPSRQPPGGRQRPPALLVICTAIHLYFTVPTRTHQWETQGRPSGILAPNVGCKQIYLRNPVASLVAALADPGWKKVCGTLTFFP